MGENHIIRKIWRVCYPMGAYLLISTAAMSALIAAMIFGVLFQSQGSDYFGAIEMVMDLYLSHYLWFMLCGTIVSIPILMLFVHMDNNRKKRSNRFVVYEKPAPVSYAALLLLGISSCIAVNGLMDLLGLLDLSPSFDAASELLYSGGILIELLVVGLVVPVAEELVFRGLVYNRLRESVSPVWAAVLSALAFGVFHGNLVQGIYAFLLGLLLAFCSEKYKTVLAPVIVHATANIVSVILTETTVLEPVFENLNNYIVITVICLLVTALSCVMIGKKLHLRGEIR